MQTTYGLETLELFNPQSYVRKQIHDKLKEALPAQTLGSLLTSSFCEPISVFPIPYLVCYLLTHVLLLKQQNEGTPF